MTDTRKQNHDQGGPETLAGNDRPLPDDLTAREPERSMSYAPSPEGNDRPEGQRPDLSARDLQANAGQDELDTRPGSDADQANEVPHVG
ncbi:MAG TPA: hypothetical protein VF699_02205 [Caulobacteraceae bacterium]|jgi:hypothetical protein